MNVSCNRWLIHFDRPSCCCDVGKPRSAEGKVDVWVRILIVTVESADHQSLGKNGLSGGELSPLAIPNSALLLMSMNLDTYGVALEVAL